MIQAGGIDNEGCVCWNKDCSTELVVSLIQTQENLTQFARIGRVTVTKVVVIVRVNVTKIVVIVRVSVTKVVVIVRVSVTKIVVIVRVSVTKVVVIVSATIRVVSVFVNFRCVSTFSRHIYQPISSNLFAHRSSPHTTPNLWNSLPHHLRSSTSLLDFLKLLKTHLH